MIRCAVFALLLGSLVGGCITTINPVTYMRDTGAPVMPERPEGCAVEIFDENQKAPRTVKVLGRVELAWSQDQVQEQGQDYAMKTLKAAVCEQGGHYILNLRALPRGFRQGMLFEGDVAVIVDDAGVPLQGVATGTSSSSDGVHGEPSASTSTAPAVSPKG